METAQTRHLREIDAGLLRIEAKLDILLANTGLGPPSKGALTFDQNGDVSERVGGCTRELEAVKPAYNRASSSEA